jgi:hypothetical protein
MRLTEEELYELESDMQGTNSFHSYIAESWSKRLGEELSYSDLVALIEPLGNYVECDVCGWVGEIGFHEDAINNICSDCAEDLENE